MVLQAIIATHNATVITEAKLYLILLVIEKNKNEGQSCIESETKVIAYVKIF